MKDCMQSSSSLPYSRCSLSKIHEVVKELYIRQLADFYCYKRIKVEQYIIAGFGGVAMLWDRKSTDRIFMIY